MTLSVADRLAILEVITRVTTPHQARTGRATHFLPGEPGMRSHIFPCEDQRPVQ